MMTIEEVAVRGGLTNYGGRNGWGPCPVCRQESRSRTKGRRGPLDIGVLEGKERWHCYACKAGGTPAELLAILRLGEIPPSSDKQRWKPILQELNQEDTGSTAGGYRPRAPISRPPKPTPPVPTTETNYPPRAEIRRVWDACVPLDRLPPHDAAVAWIEGRGLLPDLLAVMDLARVLPTRLARPPKWVPPPALDPADRPDWFLKDSYEGPFKGYRDPALHRLVLPMYDSAGDMRSLRFRAVRSIGEHDEKSFPTWAGWNTRGLVMADPYGVALLNGTLVNDARMPWNRCVVVCEGEPDFWSAATNPNRIHPSHADGPTYAVFSIVSGSWNPSIAARIPDGTQVTVWTDLDDGGDRYAEKIHTSLHPRCPVYRRPTLSPGTPS